MDTTFALQLLQIIWINILLSGDNAVVIALACRNLPEKQRKVGILIGAGAAVVLRIIFTLGINYLLDVPWLKLIGGLLLFWIAIKLITDDTEEGDVKAAASLWGAIQTVAIADIVMSLDNVIAIAAAAKGNTTLIVLGLLISIPLVVFGSQIVMSLMQKFPGLVWAGAALLGWIAGEIIVEDPVVKPYVAGISHYIFMAAGAAIVLAAGYLLRQRKHAAGH